MNSKHRKFNIKYLQIEEIKLLDNLFQWNLSLSIRQEIWSKSHSDEYSNGGRSIEAINLLNLSEENWYSNITPHCFFIAWITIEIHHFYRLQSMNLRRSLHIENVNICQTISPIRLNTYKRMLFFPTTWISPTGKFTHVDIPSKWKRKTNSDPYLFSMKVACSDKSYSSRKKETE